MKNTCEIYHNYDNDEYKTKIVTFSLSSENDL